MKRKVDFLIIGSGIAGLSYALKVAPFGKVLILTKANADESNTKYAQGGIAAVMPARTTAGVQSGGHEPDSYDKHIKDTLICGDGLCNEDVVRTVITESTERVKELAGWGAKFDKTPGGEYDLAKEGGHSEHRVLHYKDITGLEIERALLAEVREEADQIMNEAKSGIEFAKQCPACGADIEAWEETMRQKHIC